MVTKKTLLISIILSLTLFCRGQVTGDDLLGTWLSFDSKTKVEILKDENGRYHGKVVWMKEPRNKDGTIRRDVKNPNPKLRNQSKLGMIVMKDFIYYPPKKMWIDGVIYNPKDGNSYSCNIWLSDKGVDVLFMRAYVGIPAFGKDIAWTRVSGNKKRSKN